MSPILSSSGYSFGQGTTFPKIVTNGLQLYLDAGNPLSYPGTGVSWKDLSGNERNGTLSGGAGPTFSTSNGGTLVFDGINSSGNRVIVSGDIGITNGTGPLTIFCFIYPTDLTNVEEMISTISPSDGAGNGWRFLARVWNGSNSGGATVTNWGFWPTANFRSGNASSGSGNYEYLSTSSLVANNWDCLAVTYTSTTLVLYRNAIVDRTYTPLVNESLTIGPTPNLRIAAGIGFDQNYFQGRIPVYMMYNRALSQAEIEQNFNVLRGRFNI